MLCSTVATAINLRLLSVESTGLQSAKSKAQVIEEKLKKGIVMNRQWLIA
jgi:hypothetical protein